MTKVESDPLDKDCFDQNNNQNDKKSKDFKLRPKVFKIQESYICRSLLSKDVKSTYHIILAFVIYFLIANTIYYYTHPEQLLEEVRFVLESFQNGSIFFIQHFIYTAVILCFIYPATRFWINLRTKFDSMQTKIDLAFTLIIVSTIGILYLGSLATIILFEMNPIITIALVADKIRLTMKAQAFIFEAKRKQEAALEKDKKDAKFSTYRQLIYFLVAPTLVYRDEYPRLEKRDYKLLAKLFLQYFLCLYFIMIITIRIYIPIFSQIGTGPINGKAFIKSLSMVFLGASATCLLTFYSFLHLYQNIFSQIFLFGDRIFYEDWWTCTDYSTYYRKWNILVHDWIYAYLYTPLVHLLRGNKVIAGLLSIYISALAHEYIIAVALRHINPILSILFAGFGATFFVVNGLLNIAHSRKVKKALKEKKIDEIKEHHHRKKEVDVKSVDFAVNNTLFLLGTFNGWFVMITIYGIGYYSRLNCLKNNSLFPTFSLECLNIQF